MRQTYDTLCPAVDVQNRTMVEIDKIHVPGAIVPMANVQDLSLDMLAAASPGGQSIVTLWPLAKTRLPRPAEHMEDDTKGAQCL